MGIHITLQVITLILTILILLIITILIITIIVTLKGPHRCDFFTYLFCNTFFETAATGFGRLRVRCSI